MRDNMNFEFIKTNKDKVINKYFEKNLLLKNYKDRCEILFLKINNLEYYSAFHILNNKIILTYSNNNFAKEIIDITSQILLKYYDNVDIIEFIDFEVFIKRKKRRIFRRVYKQLNNLTMKILSLYKFRSDNLLLKINKTTKCLMVAPHPDDELLGAGALMIKYSNNFDCICMGSSGLSHGKGIEEGKKNSQIRVNEFNQVMDYIVIKNYWIFETYGEPRFDNQMINNLNNYCSVLNLKQYDYIFLPHPKDGHHEHRFITNKLFKKIINKVGYNQNTKIVFYEVWSDIQNPNVYFDTRNLGKLYFNEIEDNSQDWNGKIQLDNTQSLLNLKYEVLKMYKSQFKDDDIFIIQTMKKCIYNNENPIWKFRVIPITKYI